MIFREASANGYPLDGGEGKFGPAELLANMPSEEMELDEFPDPATEARTEIVGGFNSFTAASVHGPLPDREWAVDQWFPARTVCMLFGAGGVGKSLIVQQLANKVAMGEPFFNIETMKMPVLCVMCEDDKDELSRRQLDINEWMGIDEFDSGPDNLWLGPRVGHDNILVTFPNQGEAQPGKFFIKLCVEIERVKGGAENVMVILDTAADLFGGNENVRREANTFVKTYLGSIVQRYNATIVLLAHPSLSGLASGSGLSGSTAWENSVRSRAYLHRGDDDSNIRTLSRMKSNYSGIGSENDIKLIWDKGVLTEIAEPDHLDRLNQTALKNDIMARVDIAWKDKNAFRARGLRGYKMLLPRLLPRHEPAAIAKAFIELITDGNVVLVKDKGFKTGQ